MTPEDILEFEPQSPVYCVTIDTDWASDWSIRDLLEVLDSRGIRPTMFATHRSPIIDEFELRSPRDLGLHPNFLAGSTHGNDEEQVIRYMCDQFPAAEVFRSHCFFEHSRMLQRFFELGFRYDGNLCLFLQPNIVPLQHACGLIRLPVFWEDDVHWNLTNNDWDVDRYFEHFLSRGLKILNVHPFFIAANVPSRSYYEANKQHIQSLSSDNVADIRWPGAGARTFLMTLLDRLLERKAKFNTLAQVYQKSSVPHVAHLAESIHR